MVMPWELGPIGGVNAVVSNLYRRLAEEGNWKPWLHVLSWENRNPVFLKNGDVNAVRLRVRSPLEKGLVLRSLVTYAISLPGELLKVRRLVKQLGIRVVNAHYPTLAMVTVSLARAVGLVEVKLVLSFHGTDIRCAAAASPLTKVLWRWLLGRADSIVAVSQGLADEIRAFVPAAAAKTVVIHNGIDADAFVQLSDTRTELSEDLRGKTVVVAVGAYEYKKGHDVLLQAVSRLIKAYPDLHLLLVGQTGPKSIEREVEGLAAELGLSGRYTLLMNAPRSRVAECMRLGHVFVLPSRAEPFGLVLLEAGALGLPVVASRVGGIPEIIVSSDLGVLVEPDNPDALATALHGLLQDERRSREMGAAFQRRVLDVFTWEAAHQKYEGVFGSLCELGKRKATWEKVS